MNIGAPDVGEEEDASARRPNPEPPRRSPLPSPPSPLPATSERRIPRWVWLTGGGAMLLLAVVAGIIFLWQPSNSGFTLRVLKAPPGSKVYVDGISSGVPQANGTIEVRGLRPGQRQVRVTHEGFEEQSVSVSGEAGEIKEVELAPRSVGPAPKIVVQPGTTDYNGLMILVPEGTFTMGDNNYYPDEKPEHQVTLPAYYIDKYEVTNAQYKKFCDQTGRPHPPNPWWDEQYFNSRPQSPVVGVSWTDAVAYAKSVGKRLPTEAEWEKAASWGPDVQKKRQWPWGDAPEQNRANVGLKRENLKLVDVGQNAGGASAYGVDDMAGNAAEWVDAYYQPYEGNQTSNPEFGTKNRVIRGGTSVSALNDARTTRRFSHTPEYSAQEKAANSWLVGFRCAVSANDAKLQEHLKAPAQ